MGKPVRVVAEYLDDIDDEATDADWTLTFDLVLDADNRISGVRWFGCALEGDGEEWPFMLERGALLWGKGSPDDYRSPIDVFDHKVVPGGTFTRVYTPGEDWLYRIISVTPLA